MAFLQVVYFIFLLISVVYPEISDQTPTCGNNSFYIQYPFRLMQEGQNPHHKIHHRNQQFILKCSSHGFVVLNLPSSGEFYVRDIDYFEQRLQIYDPGNCFPGRLKNLSLASSPFVAGNYQNYTFFSCPPQSLSTGSCNFSAINCLSNSTASVVATSLMSMADEIKNLTGCKVIYSLQIPVSSSFPYDDVFDGDLWLAWNDLSCRGNCKGRSTSKSVVSIIMICLVTISFATLCALFCIGCCVLLARITLEINEANRQRSHSFRTRVWQMPRITLPRPLAPSVRAAQVDEFSFMSSSEVPSMPAAASSDNLSTEEVIIGGRQCITEPNSDSCPICLGEYKTSERLRLICKCKHCFHAECLEKWLQRESSCPICRTVVN